MSQPESTIFLVDDDRSVLVAVSRLLRSAGFNVRTFTSARDFIEQRDLDVYGCVVLDLAMPTCGGLEVQQLLIDQGSYLPIVFLTGRADVPSSVRAMKLGAVDFLTKPVDEVELISAVQGALTKELSLRTARMDAADVCRRLKTLTPREYQVFEHVVAGKLNKQTAADLGTGEKTIKVHRSRVMEKLHVESVADLVRLAGRAGVSLEPLSSCASVGPKSNSRVHVEPLGFLHAEGTAATHRSRGR